MELANFTHERIQLLAATDDGMKKTKKSQLLIVDRAEDLSAMLVHELTSVARNSSAASFADEAQLLSLARLACHPRPLSSWGLSLALERSG
jgi:hypothetical protein